MAVYVKLARPTCSHKCKISWSHSNNYWPEFVENWKEICVECVLILDTVYCRFTVKAAFYNNHLCFLLGGDL